MRRILKIMTLLKGAFVVILILALAYAVCSPLLICFVSVSGALHCPDLREEPMEAELAAVQAAIDVMMADNHLVEVTPSTSGEGGEKINDIGGQFHATSDLQPYIRYLPSFYCYRWQSDGLIIFQYDVNAEAKCVIDGDQLFP